MSRVSAFEAGEEAVRTESLRVKVQPCIVFLLESKRKTLNLTKKSNKRHIIRQKFSW